MKLPLPANFTVFRFPSLLDRDEELSTLLNRRYIIFSRGIGNMDYIQGRKRENYMGSHFKVGYDAGWEAPFSNNEPDPAIIDFVRMMEMLGAKVNYELPDYANYGMPSLKYHVYFWFDISTSSKAAGYVLRVFNGSMIIPTISTATRLLNNRTRTPNKYLLRNIESMDEWIYAVLVHCKVPRKRER